MGFYGLLLRLFPSSFRARYGDDMTAVFRDRLAAARRQGYIAAMACWARAVRDVITHGIAERRAEWRRATPPARPSLFARLPSSLGQDVRWAVRSALARPGFTAVALVTLALGIGANTAIFSVVHAVLIRPLPYPDADRIVRIYATNQKYHFTRGVENGFNFDYIEHRATSFESISTIGNGTTTITGAGEPASLRLARVMPAFFDIMATRPARGGAFTADQARAKAHVVVISHALWQSRLSGRADILGATLTLNGEPWTVIGVMPPGFSFPATVDLWTPQELTATERAELGSWYLGVIARAKPGIPIEAAQHDVDRLAAELAKAYPTAREGRGFNVIGLQEDLAFRVSDGLRLLQGVVIVVLLIACANVANLLLAQASSRGRELALRAAVGASRGRLIRQLLTESVVLALTGAALGAFIAVWGVHALVNLTPPYLLPDGTPIDVSWTVLAITGFAALVTGIVFGLAPALVASSPRLSAALGEGRRSAAAGLSLSRRQWLRAGLVAAEVALALVLVAGAALLVRSFSRLVSQPPGFATDHLLTAQITLPTARYTSQDARREFWVTLIDRLGHVPGVTHAAGSTAVPFSQWEWQADFKVKGREDVPNDGAGVRTVSSELFATLELPVLQGRGLTAEDTATSPRVVVVSDAFARQHLPDVDPIGQEIGSAGKDPRWATVVGVVAATRHRGLEEDLRPEMYFPLAQREGTSTLILALKTAGDPESYAGALRAAVKDLDPTLPVLEIKTMDQLIAAKVAQPRFAMSLIGLFALLAAALAVTGIAGVMAYLVNQGRREIGIRLALGARSAQVQAGVVRDGLAVVLLGTVVGLTAAYWSTALLESELFATTPRDPAAFAAAAASLLIIGVLACWIPALRTSRIDPASVLRAE